MTFFLRGSEKFHMRALNEQFTPFQTEACKLPDCSIRFIEKADGKLLFADSAFSHCIDSYPEIPALTAGDYSFAPCGDGVAFWDRNEALVWVHDGFRKIDAVMMQGILPEVILAQITMQAYRYTMLSAGGLLIHSASVIYDDGAILFCGIPGAGKSTQARLWEQTFGAEALNNDQTAVLWESGILHAHGTPWSGKEPCYKNKAVPVRAIVFVEKSPTDAVERLRPVEAFSLLYMNNLVVPAQDGIEEAFGAVVEKLAQAVPVYRQYCTMTDAAPRTLLRELER